MNILKSPIRLSVMKVPENRISKQPCMKIGGSTVHMIEILKKTVKCVADFHEIRSGCFMLCATISFILQFIVSLATKPKREESYSTRSTQLRWKEHPIKKFAWNVSILILRKRNVFFRQKNARKLSASPNFESTTMIFRIIPNFSSCIIHRRCEWHISVNSFKRNVVRSLEFPTFRGTITTSALLDFPRNH